MKPNVSILLTASLLSVSAMNAQRKELAIPQVTSISHASTGNGRKLSPDGQTYISYAIDGRIDFEPTTKAFLISWNAEDGTRQRVIFELPTRVSAVIAADVAYDQGTQLYTYSYRFSNLNTAGQNLVSVFLESAPPLKVFPHDTIWYSRALTEVWQERLGVAGGWAWSHAAGLGVRPGQSVEGFQIVSTVPPGIVRCFARGRLIPAGGEGMPGALKTAAWEAGYAVASGWTIGPVASNIGSTSGLSQASQLDALLSRLESEGWMGNGATAARVRGVATSLRAAVAANRRTEGIAQIDATLGKLGGSDFSDLLSEAKALIEYRLGALRDKLRTGS